jgi:hypothetical protein
MNNRIAVIGCSFSDYYQDKNLSDPVKTWSEWMLDDNPDIQIDNYARCAHSLSYILFVLNYIIRYRPNYYHSVMFNLPPLTRSWAPIGDHEDVVNFQNIDTWFDREEIQENYTVVQHNIKSLLLSQTIGIHKHRSISDIPAHFENLIGMTQEKNREGMRIINLLHLDVIKNYYSKVIPNLIYWSHISVVGNKKKEQELREDYPNITGNLSNTDKASLDFLLGKYGERYMAEWLLTDSSHLSSLGNRKLYEEYLLPNENFRKILKD